MSQPIIEINNLSKCYTISHNRSYKTLRESIVDLAKKPFRLLKGDRKSKKEEFWALKNINFSVNRGEKIGIIGRNGAGKTTLLKILSQITYPTTGEVKLHGRVASLLEVGTGFHMELTGRENIFLNGAILGMKQSEIRKKFDEIVEFSGVEKFLDTPVKRYSSGMHVRLAFAVAAHLEPEILLIDEVLAVGDVEFQKKCLGKMRDVATAGRTIIFVSHNMAAIEKLCSKCILLENGMIKMFGDTEKVVSEYLDIKASQAKTYIEYPKKNDKKAQIRKIRILDHNNKPSIELDMCKPLSIQITYDISEKMKKTVVTCDFYSENDLPLVATTDADQNLNNFFKNREIGQYNAIVKIPNHFFIEKKYYFKVTIQTPGVEIYDSTEQIFFEMKTGTDFVRNQFVSKKHFGYFSLPLKWEETN